MRIVNLASGSKANCTFVGYQNTKLLIDVGLSERELKARLAQIGEDLNGICAICITHEHSDHIKSLATLAKKYDFEFYVHKKLANDIVFNRDVFKPNKLHEFDNDVLEIGEVEVHPFLISHDAVCPVGFTVNVKNSKSKIGFLTDTGVVLDSMKQNLLGAKMVFLESNYDDTMLWHGTYPPAVKARIASTKGHLSNTQSLELAKELFSSGTKCFILSHISENNNTYEKAYLNYVEFFETQGLVLDKDVFVRLSFQNKHGNNFVLKEEF